MTEFQEKLLNVANMNEKTNMLLSKKDAVYFERLTRYILEANKTHNLTAIKDDDGFILKHIVDSLALVPYINDFDSICDIGCGGGFPSLILDRMCRDVSITPVDSVGKKVLSLITACYDLGITQMRPMCARAEEMGQKKEYRETFDTVTARAVGRLNLICELCLPLVKVGGRFLAMKAQSTDEELKEAQNAISLLGGQVEAVDKYTLTDGKEMLERSIIVIRKVRSTPAPYPRNNSQISKKPL
ncbi:MAG: 16S rRNA (guanine(527)-N(7))-methyltransferase RsmG [Clostridia bacterium]|nr:16S rRNA (guanine(527)-N(7))-methyltransferase RsmG [Clostridia bacterium]